MKKGVVAVLLCVIMLLGVFTGIIGHAEGNNVSVVVNGQALYFDVPPQIISGRTMVPLRAIFEALGATVSWDVATKTVTAVKENTQIRMMIGSYTMVVNEQTVILDTPSCLMNGRTLVPVRAISEAFNMNVSWDEYNQTVSIDSVNLGVSTPSTGIETASTAYNQLKNILVSRGTYSDGKYSVYRHSEDSMGGIMISYESAEDKIILFQINESDAGTQFRCLITLTPYVAPELFYQIINTSGSEYYIMGTFTNAYAPYTTTYSSVPSYLKDATDAVVDGTFGLIDAVLQLKTSMSLSDFGIYYNK
ncbi:MAG: copper amine oxidase N-terminal domain-containing protein [Clostridia bacterium]|nr:copper amine oxidase N-terminal domain-containing protein [Clostridia bacterium]